MTERILVGVAWPYANGPLHVGHIGGAYLPADIFARYHRTKGNEVLMVSGSDQHGTPVTVRAEQEGVSPADVADRYHQEFLDTWRKLGISFDLFTRTGTPNHAAVTQDFFLTLLNKGFIYKATMVAPYCPTCSRFLPDRYVEGTCPFCGYNLARGDQCEQCGKPLNPFELINPRCRFCGGPPEPRETEHFFLRLTAFNEELLRWASSKTYWRPNVLNFTIRFLQEGLKDRAITRDIEWGVPVPVAGFESKRIYVWFEAVIGYLSASIEWAKKTGEPDKWREFWQKPAKTYYFVGKDNIFFHTIIWPAMLMGYAGLNLPYDVPANEYISLEGRKISTSRNWAVWVPDYLSRFDPDALRYILSINMPETSDTDFSWREFVRRNNDELVATYGNLVHRVLTFTYRNYQGAVPERGMLQEVDTILLDRAQRSLETVGENIALCRFREGIREAMTLAQEANRYLEEKSPWKVIKGDRKAAATSAYVAISVINAMKVMLYPYLPFSSQKLHRMLGFPGRVEDSGWQFVEVPVGQALERPEALFAKLDDKVAEEEIQRLNLTPNT